MEKRNIPKKKQHIVTAASDLFKKFGPKRVTVEEICRVAKVSKMTFYKYFENKTVLVHFIWGALFDAGWEKFEIIAKEPIPYTKKVVKILELKAEASAKISHQFAQDYFEGVPGLKELLEDWADKFQTRFTAFLLDGQERGEVRRDLSPEFFIKATTKLTELVQDEALVRSYATYQEFVLEVNRFIFYGILENPDRGETAE